MSRPPNVSTVVATAAATCFGSSMAACTAIAVPPSAVIFSTTALARSGEEWYVSATRAPSAANRDAMAAPIPRLPPVIRAVLVVRGLIASSVSIWVITFYVGITTFVDVATTLKCQGHPGWPSDDTEEVPPVATRGRPRNFDRDAALRTAMDLFWRRGYEGVSVAMLTEALGITPTSLYAAFGSKAELFDEAIELYDAPGSTPTDQALTRPQTREA